MKKILLASCGNTDYRSVTYSMRIDERSLTDDSKFAFISIARFLEVQELYLLLTPEAREKHEKEILETSAKYGISVHRIDIETPKNVNQLWTQFDKVVKEIAEIGKEEEISVNLDITFAFRHLPLLFFTSIAYTEALNKAKLSGIFYAALDAKESDGAVPIFDITKLADILRGAFAVREFEKTGHIADIKPFVNRIQNNLNVTMVKEIEDKDNVLKKISSPVILQKNVDFEKLEKLFLNGLTIEYGIEANSLLRNLESFDSPMQAVKDLIKRIHDKIEPIVCEKNYKKAKLILDINELKRQLEFIKWHYEIGNISTTWVLIREWIVTRVMLANNSVDSFDKPSDWLNHNKYREPIENKLNQLGHKFKQFSEYKETGCYRLLELWYHNIQIRNQYAHAGHCDDVVDTKKGNEKLKDLIRFCELNIEIENMWKLPEKINNSDD